MAINHMDYSEGDEEEVNDNVVVNSSFSLFFSFCLFFQTLN